MTVALLSTLCGCLFLSGGSLVGRLADPYSDENIAREVERAVAWIDDLIYRAATEGKNFDIAASYTPSCVLIAKWQGGGEAEEWRSERISMRVLRAESSLPGLFRYDWRTQMLTPALTLLVFKQKDHYANVSGWFIIVSGHGLTRASKTAP